MNLSDLQRDAFKIAVTRGQWPTVDDTTVINGLMHAVTELGEVFRELRHWRRPDRIRYTTVFGQPTKPEGIPIELADVVICVASIAEALDIDLASAVALKMAYNATRAGDAVAG
jgi:NTP pyrophosphatase (non-canonical NTP hydrolase)